MKTAAVLGASGYAGGELVRLLDAHPGFEVGYLGGHSSAGARLGDVHPQLRGGDRLVGPNDVPRAAEADVVFLALPHGASAEPATVLVDAGVPVVDLGSDFRLDTPERYLAAYGSPHPYPASLEEWVYGLPELFGDSIAGAGKVAAPGCYPTSALLALGPLLAAGVVAADGIVVASLSGVSGAGRSTKADLLYGVVDESVKAYAVTTHRHRPEIEMGLERVAGVPASVVFTPHLVPMQRGILSTCHARPVDGVGPEEVAAALTKHYAGAPFVEVIDHPPQTRWVVGSNRCLISAHHDEPTGTVIVISAIDNLLKGAAGQAVQCANLMVGYPETDGLPLDGWMP